MLLFAYYVYYHCYFMILLFAIIFAAAAASATLYTVTLRYARHTTLLMAVAADVAATCCHGHAARHLPGFFALCCTLLFC